MKIETIPFREQIADAQAVTDFDSYEGLYKKYFVTSYWPDRVDHELAKPEFADAHEDLYRLMGISAILFAQYGFPMLDGQEFRHKKYEWEKSFLTPEHQVATIVYAANLNTQSYEHKEERRTNINDPRVAEAVWGIPLLIHQGKVFEPIRSDKVLHGVVRKRARSSVPVALPYKRINERLASIDFTGMDADTISPEQFAADILPQFNTVFTKNFVPMQVNVKT